MRLVSRCPTLSVCRPAAAVPPACGPVREWLPSPDSTAVGSARRRLVGRLRRILQTRFEETLRDDEVPPLRLTGITQRSVSGMSQSGTPTTVTMPRIVPCFSSSVTRKRPSARLSQRPTKVPSDSRISNSIHHRGIRGAKSQRRQKCDPNERQARSQPEENSANRRRFRRNGGVRSGVRRRFGRHQGVGVKEKRPAKCRSHNRAETRRRRNSRCRNR